jgi:hypothetical protein
MCWNLCLSFTSNTLWISSFMDVNHSNFYEWILLKTSISWSFPWIRSFDLFRHRRFVIVSWAIYDLFSLGVWSWERVPEVWCCPFFQGDCSSFLCLRAMPAGHLCCWQGLPSRTGRKWEATLRETNWSSNNGGVADGLLTIPRKLSTHKQWHATLDTDGSNDKRSPWKLCTVYVYFIVALMALSYVMQYYCFYFA